MTTRAHGGRGGRRRAAILLAALVAAPLSLVVGATSAQAATTTVTCTNSTGDISLVQAAVNAAGNGDTIALSGTCDFSAAPAVGGDQVASIEHAAVLIRPFSPVTGLTITSAGASQSAIIRGSGIQAGFAIGPNNRDVTIKGLQFVNLARPVVVLNNADGATVGSADGATPSPAANRILGSAGMIAGVTVYASSIDGDGRPSTSFGVDYGEPGGLGGFFDFGPQGSNHLENVTVAGNYISFDPPGVGDQGNPLQAVGVDARIRASRLLTGLDIKFNAIGMFTPEAPYYNWQGISLHSHCCADSGDPDVLDASRLPGDYTAAQPAKQYYIRDVDILSNNLGRFEEIEDALRDVDPALANSAADVHSTGRVGINLLGVGTFTVAGNGVRALGSPTAIPMPTGGVVVSDSGFGEIAGNGVIVLVDETVGDADLGAIAVIDDSAELLGDAGHEQRTESVLVRNNTVGPVSQNTQAPWARRGIVVAGASRIAVTGNTTKGTTGPALNVAPRIVGPGNPNNPNVTQQPLRAQVRDSVLCNNNLDGTVDAPSEVSYNPAPNTPRPSTGNGLPSANTSGNQGCQVRITSVSDRDLVGSDTLALGGTAWGNRPVTVTVTDSGTGSATKTPAADANGVWTTTFTAADLSGLATGPLQVRATAHSVPAGYSSTSLAEAVTKSAGPAPLPAGVVGLVGGEDGLLNAAELSPLTVVWQAGSANAVSVSPKLLVNGVLPHASCEATDVPIPSGSANPLAPCMAAVNAAADGAVIKMEMTWKDGNGTVSALASASATKDATFGATLDIETVTIDQAGVATVTGKVLGSRSEVSGNVFLAALEGDRFFGFLDGRTATGFANFDGTTGAFTGTLDVSRMHDGEISFGGRIVDAAKNKAEDTATATKSTGENQIVALVEDAVEFTVGLF